MSQDFARVGAAVAQVPGTAGAVVTHPDGELLYALRPDEPFPAASVIKLPLVMALHAEAAAGRLDLTERLGPGVLVDGTGVLRELR
ncbi:MAG: serine hydrolase, partial [Gallionella sp.]|nr:serine hydrolase [Gallionella sp.]